MGIDDRKHLTTLKTKVKYPNKEMIVLSYDILFDQDEITKYLTEDNKLILQPKGLNNHIKESRHFEYDSASHWPTKINTEASITINKDFFYELNTEYILIKK